MKQEKYQNEEQRLKMYEEIQKYKKQNKELSQLVSNIPQDFYKDIYEQQSEEDEKSQDDFYEIQKQIEEQ